MHVLNFFRLFFLNDFFSITTLFFMTSYHTCDPFIALNESRQKNCRPQFAIGSQATSARIFLCIRVHVEFLSNIERANLTYQRRENSEG